MENDKKRKVLISPGYGAGWSSWNEQAYKADFLFDELLVREVEKLVPGDKFDVDSPAIKSFSSRMKEKHGDKYFCVLGCGDLEVFTVVGDFIVEEYDGSEYIKLRDEIIWN